tara:strand:+ start:880 stop:1125 length:246 start_codon:yes stop_codon:yes gene_type:complete
MNKLSDEMIRRRRCFKVTVFGLNNHLKVAIVCLNCGGILSFRAMPKNGTGCEQNLLCLLISLGQISATAGMLKDMFAMCTS